MSKTYIGFNNDKHGMTWLGGLPPELRQRHAEPYAKAMALACEKG